MQKMLEETLLKNLHLQQDVEAMSLEVVRLSKLASPSKWIVDRIFSVKVREDLVISDFIGLDRGGGLIV